LPDSPAPGRRFARNTEDFTCAHCGASVHGTGYTNHCPQCLWSMHVDVFPGDRAETCHGLMEPVSAAYERDELVLTHRCTRCGTVKRNRTAPDDDPGTIRTHLGRTVE